MSLESNLMHGLGLAFTLGSFGQSFRAAVGLKKLVDSGKRLREVFDAAHLFGSLAVGGMAGVTAFLAMTYGSDQPGNFSQGSFVLGVLTAGYSGADFIESVAKKYLKS